MSFVSKHMFRLIAAAALLGIFVAPASAQEVKIGFVNMTIVMERAPQTKAAMDALQEEFAPRQREFLAKQKEFEELTAKAQKDVAVMGETERKNLEKNLRDLQREVTRLQTEFREDLNLRQNEELGLLQRSIFAEVQDYGAREGFDLIVYDNVLYASGSVNITEEVLRSVEANFQATGATQ